jgi:LuxR family maltose regulon positive regulatory protein
MNASERTRFLFLLKSHPTIHLAVCFLGENPYNDIEIMSDLLLKTKIVIPPLRKEIVQRNRLLDRMLLEFRSADGFNRQLTLVSAPAGYGKTTVVCDWIKRLGFPLAWLSLDETDNDPTRFLAYIIAAIQQVREGLGEAAGKILLSPQRPPIEVVLTVLINELALVSSPLILVLDDYHAIHTLSIHEQLKFLLEHQPGQLHLVIVSREDPLLPIPRLRARNKVLEIRQEDLRFTVEETTDFLNRVMRLDLTSAQIAALEGHTEGWIAGLQLAALSMRGNTDVGDFIEAFTGSSRYILDYLVEEVFEKQPPDLKEFLLKTSVLGRLSPSLCDAVAGRTDSQSLLEALEQMNLFIVPFDQSREWYRYHRLFAELLRHHLRIDVRDAERDLHIRAGDWFEKNGYFAEAIQHAISAQDWSRAKSLLQRVNSDMLKRGEVATLIRWYSSLPEAVLMADPRLCFDYCWALLVAGQFSTAAPLLEHVEQTARSIPEFLGEVFTAQAFLARGQGDNARMVEKSRRALGLLPKTSASSRGLVALNLGLAYWHMGRMEQTEEVLVEAREAAEAIGNIYGVLTATILHGRVFAVRGQLHQAKAVFEQAIERGGAIPINALAHLDLCTLYYEWNNLPESESHLRTAIELSERGQNEEFLVSCWGTMSYLRIARNDFDGAREALAKAQELVDKGNIPALTADRVDVFAARLALAQNDPASIHRWVDSLRDDVDSHPFYRFIGLTKAHLLWADHKREETRAFLDQLYRKSVENGWQYGRIAVRISQALAADTEETAGEYLAEALRLAEAEGFIRVFVDAGESIIPLLRVAAKHGVTPEYVRRILTEVGGKAGDMGAGVGSLVEPLSEREVEVLRLVTKGLSNREIAAKLFISAGTAKTHIHNLCGKLGVRNRTEAAMRAKELNLV